MARFMLGITLIVRRRLNIKDNLRGVQLGWVYRSQGNYGIANAKRD